MNVESELPYRIELRPLNETQFHPWKIYPDGLVRGATAEEAKVMELLQAQIRENQRLEKELAELWEEVGAKK